MRSTAQTDFISLHLHFDSGWQEKWQQVDKGFITRRDQFFYWQPRIIRTFPIRGQFVIINGSQSIDIGWDRNLVLLYKSFFVLI